MNERADVDADVTLAELERRLAVLEQAVAHPPGGAMAVPPPRSTPPVLSASPALDPEVFWVVDGLRARVPSPGAVVYAGSIETVRGPVVWQYGATMDDLAGRDWGDAAGRIGALGHPARLAILQNVLSGVATVAELTHAAELGSAGQTYHHLHLLVAEGWLAPAGRGRYAIPAERVVPLLAILTAAGGAA